MKVQAFLQTLRIFSISSALMVGFWLPLRMIGYQVTDSINLFCDLLVSIVSVANIYLHFKEKESRFRNIAEWFNLTVLADVVCLLPLYLIDTWIFGGEHSWLLFFNLFTCRHIWRIKSFLDQFPTLHAVYHRIIPILMMLPLLVHLVACGWISLGSGNAGPDSDKVMEYIKAIYWSFTTLTTVGYGDLTPKSAPQMLYACLIQVVGVGVFGFVISNVASLLSRLDAAREHHMDNIDRVDTFMRSHHIPAEMQGKVRRYFHYLWQRHKGFQDRTLLKGLPAKMQSELFFFINQPVVSKVALFKGASHEFIEHLVHELHPKIFVPGEKVFRAGDVGDAMYFIHHGEVEILDTNKSRLATIQEGAFFGEMALVSDQPRTASARCLSYCDMYVLSKKSFDKILNDHPEFRLHVETITKSRRSANAA